MLIFSLKDKQGVKDLGISPKKRLPIVGYVLQDDGDIIILPGIIEDPYREVTYSLGVALPRPMRQDDGVYVLPLRVVLAAMHASLRVWWTGMQAADGDHSFGLDEAYLTVKFQGCALTDVFCSTVNTVERTEELCHRLRVGREGAPSPTSFFRLPEAAAPLTGEGEEGTCAVPITRLRVVHYCPEGGEPSYTPYARATPYVGVAASKFLADAAPRCYVSSGALREALKDYLGGLFDAGVEVDEWAHGAHALEVSVPLYGDHEAVFRFDGEWLSHPGVGWTLSFPNV